MTNPIRKLDVVGNSSSVGTGTISNAPNSTTVTGVGTSFKTQLHVGDIIIVGTLPPGNIQQRIVATIGTTSLTTSQPFNPPLTSSTFSYQQPIAALRKSGETTPSVLVNSLGNVGVGTSTPGAKLHVAEGDVDNKAFIRASNFNPIPVLYWPNFDAAAPYLLKNALWVGWDNTEKAWKYYKESAGGRGLTDPGNPTGWSVNGTTIGCFDGDLASLPPGTHSNNRYNPKMMAFRCNEDDIQVKVGSFWVDKYPCRIIDVGATYSGMHGRMTPWTCRQAPISMCRPIGWPFRKRLTAQPT